MKFNKAPYFTREGRNKFIYDTFKECMSKSILNVGGGGERYLLQHLDKETRHFEIDKFGNPDMIFDLEKDDLNQFKTNEFETVICTDVLEHIDNFHEVFDHIIRISNKNVIISLPNCYKVFFAGLKNPKALKHYGLPISSPSHRHKWFFSYTDIENFFKENQKTKSYKLDLIIPLGLDYKKSFLIEILFSILKLFIKKDLYNNIRVSTAWIKISTS